MKKITALDVIRTFYISNELLGKVFKTPNKEKLNQNLKKIIKKSRKLSKEYLLNYDLGNYQARYDNYLNSKWKLKEISLSDYGV